jgi:GTP 3',8-cyclase
MSVNIVSRGSESETRVISYLRLSITDKCDLRCNYCIPSLASVPCANSLLTSSEIDILVRAFANNGITKVRLTGGEPLLRDDVVQIVQGIADTPGIATVGLTTNGIRLAEMARDLADAGLRRVNISVDSLDRGAFRRITGRDALDDVLRGVDAALRCGFEKVKLNTVVMRGINDTEIPAIANLARQMPVEVRFIELMPLGHSTEEWQAMHVPAASIKRALGSLEPLPYEDGSSARRFRLAGSSGIVGIISPMSENFCDACNRVRVTCHGVLKPCLRLPIHEDLRPLLGSPDTECKLSEVMGRMCQHKLSGSSASCSAVQSEAMCSVGG